MGYARRKPKFSQAQKAAAIEHYLTHDRCIAATMRELGYPGAWNSDQVGSRGPS